MKDKKVYLTKEGLKDLENELDNLILVERKEVAEAIKEARALGDLSENAEYDAARERQAEVEGRIQEVEEMLKNVELIEEGVCSDKVTLGCKVVIYDEELKEDQEYKIVGSTEANPMEGKISNESPVGEALIGRKEGDNVEVEVPAGIIKYKIKEISN
ncbi:MAG: transcription elongation factor GreA [Clostridia bacterium]|nr:transcription elongation factor GreA [Clostridia bacterium]